MLIVTALNVGIINAVARINDLHTSHANEKGLSVAVFIQPVIVKVRIERQTFVVDIRRFVVMVGAVPVEVFHFETCSPTVYSVVHYWLFTAHELKRTKLIWTDWNKSTQLPDAFIGHVQAKYRNRARCTWMHSDTPCTKKRPPFIFE